MSKKSYKPRDGEKRHEDFEKSILGLSIKQIKDQGASNLRESLIIAQTTPRKASAPVISQLVRQDKRNSIFSEFFIIGIDPSSILKQDLDNEVPVEPKTLYMFKDNIKTSTCQRRQVVKDFCFPNGVQIRTLKKKRAHKILYGQQSNSKENSFVFTLQAQDMNSFDTNAPDEFIYCNVLIFDEIHKTPESGFFTSQKALCFMSNYRFFELYLQILNVIYSLYKIERFNILQEELKVSGILT